MEGLLDKAWQSPLQTSSVAGDGFPRFQEAPGGRTGIPSILGGKAWEGWAEVCELYKIFGTRVSVTFTYLAAWVQLVA